MDYREKYNDWIRHLKEDDPLRKELASIEDCDKEIRERFCQDLSFGTAGLRGRMGAGSNMMNRITVGRASCGIADLIRSRGEEAMRRGVVIAHDPRHHSREFSELTARIFASKGIRVYCFPDLRPTPELAFMIRYLGAVSGINITASHNPKEYNGYKAYWEDGCQVSEEMAALMTSFIERVDPWETTEGMPYDQSLITVLGEEYDRAYLDKVLSLSIHKGDDIDLSIPIVYTPLNGAGSIPFCRMLMERGFSNWQVVEEQRNPDPDFTTVGYPNPEDSRAFALSERYGKEMGADLLMATDPDSDRFAAEIRKADGEYLPLNGNQTGYLLVNYILEGRKTAGLLPEKGAIVKSIVTSTLSERIAEAYGVRTFETLTGFKNICGKIPYLKEHGYTYLFGYEESVGYAACEDIRDKDGISAGMLLAEAAAYYRKRGKSLWDVLMEIYSRYGYFAEDQVSIIEKGLEGKEKIDRMMRYTREHLPEQLAGLRVSKIIDYMDGYQDIPPQNCLRIFLSNGSWLAIRPSGTEPKIKFYFYACGGSKEEAEELDKRMKDQIIADISASSD